MLTVIAYYMERYGFPGNVTCTRLIGISVSIAAWVIPYFQELRSAIMLWVLFPLVGIIGLLLLAVLFIWYVFDLRDGLATALVMMIYAHIALSTLDILRDQRAKAAAT